jgi:hypothetical protein
MRNKLIDAQVQNAQVTADLKNAVDDNNENLKDLQVLLSQINSHFSNGFRQELKDSITEAARHIESEINIKSAEGQKETNKIMKALTDFTSALKSPKAWIGTFLIIASIFGVVAGIVALVSKFTGGP